MVPKTFKASSQGRLRDREERFRTTVDNAPLGISHTDKQGRWLLHTEAQKHLNEIAREVSEKGIRTRSFLLHGDPATVIVRVAQEQRVSLIVIATFGKTGWRRFAFGSVTEKVVRLATCPVLTVPGVEQPAAAD